MVWIKIKEVFPLLKHKGGYVCFIFLGWRDFKLWGFLFRFFRALNWGSMFFIWFLCCRVVCWFNGKDWVIEAFICWCWWYLYEGYFSIFCYVMIFWFFFSFFCYFVNFSFSHCQYCFNLYFSDLKCDRELWI